MIWLLEDSRPTVRFSVVFGQAGGEIHDAVVFQALKTPAETAIVEFRGSDRRLFLFPYMSQTVCTIPPTIKTITPLRDDPLLRELRNGN